MIEFRSVTLSYPQSQRTIVENLSFAVHEGEMVLISGRTGSGKSSILKLMNGLVPHHTGGILSGEITIAGISTSSRKPGEFADLVGVVGQNPINGFVCDNVEEEIAFTLENLGYPVDVMRKRVEEILDLLGLVPLRDREIISLSGGEQQRVAIAAALVTQPKVLLLDEPTSALDPIAAEEVLSLLNRLVHDLGITVIVAEHRLERVIQFVDRILLVKGDGSAEIGETRTILKSSPLVPPLIELARVMHSSEMPVSIREFRRGAPTLDRGFDGNESTRGAPAAELKKLSASYEDSGANFALADISLSLYRSEIVALMGRNGAGKSTLLKSFVGQSPIISGAASVLGEDPRGWSNRELISRVGFVPQNPGDLLYGQSVAEECRFSDRDNGVIEGTTFSILRKLIGDIDTHRHPRDLSEGQLLSLALSIILSAQPTLILLDEPTRGLDYIGKRELVKILKGLARDEKRSIFIATHDVELVAELADRAIFIADGELIADGSARAILNSSPAFAPQVAKAFPDKNLLTVDEVKKVLPQ